MSDTDLPEPPLDGYPAPEARVREFVEAWNTELDLIEDADYGTPLTVSDLRDVLAELDAARAEIARLNAVMDRALEQGQDDIGLSDAYGVIHAEREPDPCAGCGQAAGFGHISGCPVLHLGETT